MLKSKEIKLATTLLKENKVVILPTDTIYGLSAIFNEENEKQINLIKKSDQSKKLIVLFSKLSQIKNLVKITEQFKKNTKSKEPITQILKTKNSSIALRMVKRKDLKKIINRVGLIYSTSVNYSGNPFLTKLEEFRLFNIKVSEVFWDGELISKPSKIIDLIENKVIR
ncbi:L-threonylcarbamoyladenylate synthase [Spiroplasma diminutum]|uniref:L-threonylcarbamoyladenylate synthase n=1 Tax=Spiroplasma diminutum CUAS-1 TaxID=1276221 RepID=S5LX77_9MOLU|nr:Sua5/YciO/YrdC/YwlC family protein [Spiroplasma diminutum]AGR42419.1 tRNA threonylcarbamoyladenosine biosynthesis protein [Spiroplasma diminutum CUAS-1]